MLIMTAGVTPPSVIRVGLGANSFQQINTVYELKLSIASLFLICLLFDSKEVIERT